MRKLDALIESRIGKDTKPTLIPVDVAVQIVNAAYALLEFEDGNDHDKTAHQIILEHLSKTCTNTALKSQVYAMVSRDHVTSRLRKDDRPSDSPENDDRRKTARSKAQDVPVVMLLRENGDESKGWRGLPFWWPVIFTPASAPTTVFATEQPTIASTGTSIVDRPLASDANQVD